MSISTKSHFTQANHIEPATICSNINDTSKTSRGELASAAIFILSLLCSFGKILCFQFKKLYGFINKQLTSPEKGMNTETPKSSIGMQSDTDVTSSSLHTDIEETTEGPIISESLEDKETEHDTSTNPNPAALTPTLSPLLLMNVNAISNIFSDSSDDDIIMLSTTKMLVQDILSKDKFVPDPTFSTHTSSAWKRESITPPIIRSFLSPYAVNPAIIPPKPKCRVPLNILHNIQRMTEMPFPSKEEILDVKTAIFQTADKILQQLQNSPDCADIRQTDDTTSHHPLSDIKSSIINNSSLEDIDFGEYTCIWEKPRYTANTNEEDLGLQYVHDICHLSEIYSQLTSISFSIDSLSISKLPVRIRLSHYHSELFDDKQVCSSALANTAYSMDSYAREFTHEIKKALSIFMLYIGQENIKEELSKMVAGDRTVINRNNSEIQKLNQGYDQLQSMLAQRCCLRYPDPMCLLISDMLSGSSQYVLKQGMESIFQTIREAKYGSEQPTDAQREGIINDIKLAFRRCTQEVKALLVMQHQEQALKDGVPQEKIQRFLYAEDLIPELLEPPVHLIQNNL